VFRFDTLLRRNASWWLPGGCRVESCELKDQAAMSDPELSRAIKGWFLACVAASAVLVVFALDDCVKAQFGVAKTLVALPFYFLVTFVPIFIATFAPSASFLWLANLCGLRQPLVYFGFGTALGRVFAFCFSAPPALTWQLTAAGFAAGAVYWLVAERAVKQTV
jgi:hypothetical protein